MSCFPIRYLIVLAMSLVGFVAFVNRSNLTIAIVAMVDRPNATAEHPNLCPIQKTDVVIDGNKSRTYLTYQRLVVSDELLSWSREPNANDTKPSNKKYDWSPETQGIVLGSFYYTYFILQVPAGYIISRIGSRTPIVLACLLSGIISIACPFVADVSVEAFISLRMALGIVQAVIFPASFVLICSWVPLRERSTALAIHGAGINLAMFPITFASGYLINAYTWRFMFFMPGVISLAIGTFLFMFLRNKPEDHCLVSPAELELIRGRCKDETEPLLDSNENPIQQASRNEAIVKDPIPWFKILTNKAVLSWIVFKAGKSYMIFLVGTEMPTYLVTVLNMDITTIGIIGAVNSVCGIVTGVTVAKISEVMIERNYCTRTSARKLFSIFNGFLDAVFIMLVPAFRCNQVAVMIVYTASAITGAFSGAVEVPMAAEMSTKFHGMLFAIGNLIGTLPGFIAPMITGFVLEDVEDQRHAWDMLFYPSGALVILGNIVFLLFASAERQSFDFSDEERLQSTRRYDAIN